jgi:hypothetical protein
MEFLGVTRQSPDGSFKDVFVIRCEIHDWYYKGLPPLTTGCKECWSTYYVGQITQAGGDMKTNIDQLESAVHHAVELEDKGQWDFKPDFSVEFGKEN